MGLFGPDKPKREPGWFERDQPEVPEWRKKLDWISPAEKFRAWREGALDGLAKGFVGETGTRLIKKALWMARDEQAKEAARQEESKKRKGRGY
jgi:hypothetical protein